MVRNVIILGNSGAATESFTLLKDMLTTPCLRTVYSFKGFLSHKGFKGNLGDLAHFELGSDSDYTPQKYDVFALGIGDNKIRYEAYIQMKEKGGEFINLISPHVAIAEDVEIGEANNFLIGCHISARVSIGDANYFNGNARIGHDVKIGDGNFFGNQSMIMGSTTIGNKNQIAPAAIIMEKCKVGNNNNIAPASVLYKGCKDSCLMAGNPAIKMTTLEA